MPEDDSPDWLEDLDNTDVKDDHEDDDESDD